MKPERGPAKTDRVITDNEERRLFGFQIARKVVGEKITSGEKNPVYARMAGVLDKEIELAEQIVGEQDPDKKDGLKSELRDFLSNPEVVAIVNEWESAEAEKKYEGGMR